MSTRYQQYCPVARALEVVGERWTLLVARELMLGPRRFTDLQTGLPGIGTNMLTRRLKELEQAGLVAKRRLPAPAASVVYELTDDAVGLAPVLAAMAEWGLHLLGPRRKDEEVRSAWWVLAAAVTAKMLPSSPDGIYELHLDGEPPDGEVFHIRCHDGNLQPSAGPARDPDAVITLGTSTLVALVAGEIAPGSAKARKLIAVEGDAVAARRLLASLCRPSPH